jgi:hypothetical protein
MVEQHGIEVEERRLQSGELIEFHQWADAKPCEGAFLLRKANGEAMWMVLVDWKRESNFYVVLFPASRSGPIAELHKCTFEDGHLTLHWQYSPRKRDNKNPERRAYFEEVFLSTDVIISVPTDVEAVGDFLGELFALAQSRRKADDLDDDRPPVRDSFPDGKVKQRLHLSRERNQKIVRQAKDLAMQREGCLKCACCEFEFEPIYGRIGSGFIEAHHTKPLSTLHEDGEETRVEDVALVCANCHRMLHRYRPWLGIQELKRVIGGR